MKTKNLILIVALISALLVLMVMYSSMKEIDNQHQQNQQKGTASTQQHEEHHQTEQEEQTSPQQQISRKNDQNHDEVPSSNNNNNLLLEKVIRDDDEALLNSNLPKNSNNNHEENSLREITLSSCQEAKNCLSCLFRVQEQDSSSSGCVWLASREQCVDSTFAKKSLPGVDSESVACPAILHSQSQQEKSTNLVPAKLNVVHVAIRKGGPEALIQLHLALAYWGFNTNLDSRKSKKQKGGPVVPFFKEMYSREFSRVNGVQQQFRSHFADYDNWQRSGKEGDVLIATETWKCRNDRISSISSAHFSTSTTSLVSLLTEPMELRKSGVRYAQWHLTVWPRKPRSGCTIMVHTRYIGEVFMRAPLLSLLFPYVSPHIVRFADKLRKTGGDFETVKKKENNFKLLMFDGDMKMSPEVFNSENSGGNFLVKKATGFTPQQLYEEYSKTSVCLDWELPGGERFIYESALFGCCSIVDRSLNGLDTEDFPLPDSLRVLPTSKQSTLSAALLVSNEYTLGTKKQQEERRRKEQEQETKVNSMHQAISLCTNPNTRPKTMQALEPLRLSILKQRVRFHRHVRRYFSNNIHIVTSVSSLEEFKKYVAQFIMTTLIAIPFATIEVVLHPSCLNTKHNGNEDNNNKILKEQINLMMDHSYLSAVLWTVDSSSNDEEKTSKEFFNHVVEHSPSIITTSSTRVGSVAFIPVHSVIRNRNFVHYLTSISSILRKNDQVTIFIKGENFYFLNSAKMFGNKEKKEVEAKLDLSSKNNIISFEEAEKKAIISKSHLIGDEKKLIWENFLMLDDGGENEEDKKWKKFLCEHAVYEMLFSERC